MNTQNHQFEEHTAITASVVPDELRIGFWQQHFGSIPQWITLEPRIFASDGSAVCRLPRWYLALFDTQQRRRFMAPESDHDEKWILFNSMNGNGAELTSEAAGMVACLMAYNHHACRTECDAMTEHYYRLRDYALEHPECSAIMHIIA